MNDIPPSAIPAAQAAAAKAAAAARCTAAAALRAAPAASNSQDDIDAMLAGLDEATSEAEIRPPQPDGEVFELTDEMALPDAAAAAAFHKVEPEDDLEFTETAAARAVHRQPAFEPPPFESPAAPPPQQILSRSTVSAVESAFNTPCPYRAQQQRADAGRPGQGNAAADAEILARRQSARTGGAHRQGGNRAGFARPLDVRVRLGPVVGPDSAITSGFILLSA